MDKNIIISLQQLLAGRNSEFDASNNVKLVRHKDNRKASERTIFGKLYKGSLYHLYRNDKKLFLDYQSEQKRANFEKVEYIVTFIGEIGTESRFVGIYKNNGIIRTTEKDLCVFDFQEIDGDFDILKERVIIDWGKSTLNWHQWYDNNTKTVIRIDKGINADNIPDFTSYEDVILSYCDLKHIIDTENSIWKSKLSACNCIYSILDKSNGKLYIGSTYNKEGIWKRWKDYAFSGHGGDISLKQILNTDQDYALKNFQWSILETLPLNILEELAIDRESVYKEKFGTREYGYNNN